MHKTNLALVTLACLTVVACAKAEPKASIISKSEIAAEQRVNENDDLGRVAIYFEEIDLAVDAYPRSHRFCPPLDHQIDLTKAYIQTLHSGFKQGFPNAEYVNAPLSINEMKVKNIHTQIRLKAPVASVSYLFDDNFFTIDYAGFAALKGTLLVANQSGGVRQKILNISNSEELPTSAFVTCHGAVAELMENAATKTIKQFVMKNISTAKDMIRILNPQN